MPSSSSGSPLQHSVMSDMEGSRPLIQPDEPEVFEFFPEFDGSRLSDTYDIDDIKGVPWKDKDAVFLPQHIRMSLRAMQEKHQEYFRRLSKLNDRLAEMLKFPKERMPNFEVMFYERKENSLAKKLRKELAYCERRMQKMKNAEAQKARRVSLLFARQRTEAASIFGLHASQKLLGVGRLSIKEGDPRNSFRPSSQCSSRGRESMGSVSARSASRLTRHHSHCRIEGWPQAEGQAATRYARHPTQVREAARSSRKIQIEVENISGIDEQSNEVSPLKKGLADEHEAEEVELPQRGVQAASIQPQSGEFAL